jgi:hypothetical protein
VRRILMSRGKVYLVLSVFLVLCTCRFFAQEERDLLSRYGAVGLADGRRIVLRYSTIDEVLMSLGEPSEKQHFARKSEDFLWSDFDIYTYRDRNLRFFFEGKGRKVIRIDANIPKLDDMVFPLGFSAASSVDSIVNTLRRSPGVVKVDTFGERSLSYSLGLGGFIGLIRYDSPEKEWYYMYFSAPWEGYDQ